MEELKRERRQLDIVRTGGVLVALLAQVVAIVWGAATLSSSVHQLEVTTNVLALKVDRVVDLVNNSSTRISVLEDRAAIRGGAK